MTDEGRSKIRRLRFWKSFGFKILITVVLFLILSGFFILLRECQRGSLPEYLTWGAALVYYSATLAFAVWLFSIFSVLLRKSIVFVVCFSVLFVWGSASYFMWHVDDDSPRPEVEHSSLQSRGQCDAAPDFIQLQLEAPNRAISAFFPSRGGFERLDRRYLHHYFLFHLLVLSFVAAVMFSHFGRGLVNRFKKRCVVKERLLNVFWGVNDIGLMLARNVVETSSDEQVAFLLPDELRLDEEKFKSAVWQLDQFDAMWMLADFSRPSSSDARGHRHFFLDKSGHVNVSHANQLVKAMERCGIQKPGKVFLYVRIEAAEEERVFFKWAESVGKIVTPIIIRESDMIARRFIEDNPMLDCPGIEIDPDTAMVKGSFRILLLGLGTTGQSVLREMVSNAQFQGTSGFSVDVIERDPAVRETYRAQHAEAIEKYNINLVGGVHAEEVDFEDFLAERLRSYNRIVACLSDDVMNIRVASHLMHCVTKEGIGPLPNTLFVLVSDPNRRSYFAPKEGMTLFGDFRDVYSLATLDYDTLDRMAKVLNGEWAKDKSDAGLEKAWHEASFNNQRSSRASALGERNLARVAGFRIVPASDSRQAVTKQEFDAALAGTVGRRTRLEVLAEDEHMRWNAYHWMLGYSRWDMKTPPLESVSQKKANQIDTFGKHACLVDFSKLPDVDYAIACAIREENRQKFKPVTFLGNVSVDVNGDGKPKFSLQAYDFMFVQKIWENAAAAGMKLVQAERCSRCQ